MGNRKILQLLNLKAYPCILKQRTLVITTLFVAKDIAVTSNLLL